MTAVGYFTEKELETRQKEMQDEDSQFTDLRSDHINNREKILKANVLLSKRHKQMVYELNLIYPIEQVYIHVKEF